MSEEKPRRRKAAAAPNRHQVKASILVGSDLHSRWTAAASLAGMSQSAFAVEALTEALRGFIIIDKRKSSVGKPAGRDDLSISGTEAGSASDAA